MKFLIFLCSFGLLLFSENAFASACDSLKWEVQIGTNLSYNGTDLNIALGLTQNRHHFYVGPQVLLSDSYFPQRNIGGFLLGYRHQISARKRWASFVNVESQFSFLNTAIIPLKNASEVYLGYGLQYRLNERFSIGNTIGVGGYLEQFEVVNGDTDSFSAYAVLIALYLGFEF